LISATGITVRLGGRELLHGVSLALAPGSFTALLGPNGAGKTTLLRVLAGALLPDAGQVTLDGARLSTLGPVVLARRRAVLSQHSTPVLALTVAETVALGRLMFRGTASAADDRSALAETRARFALEPLWSRPLAGLSGGERQRVHIARAAVQIWRRNGRADGLALFLDEPAASLDLARQVEALDFARDCADRGAAVLGVLHDPNHARSADQVALLRDGRMLRCGPTGQVLQTEHLTACLGVPLHVARKQDGTAAFVV
jgi:iron complex transport system ATP-binding protein